MSIPPFLTDFLIVLIIAILVAITFERFRLPHILGFLIAGVIIGPHGFGLLSDTERINSLAELGVVLLMLTIGLEFSFQRLKSVGNIAIWGGTLQILISIVMAMLFTALCGLGFYEGFFIGSVIALSSTAIVLRYLIERNELHTQYGRITVSILVFQDLAVVPLMILIAGFGQSTEFIIRDLSFAFIKTSLLMAIVFAFARWVLPRLLYRIAMLRNREIFFLSSVVICLGTAWLSGFLGLSLAIGAFFAGLMFANTEFGHELIGEIAPFRYLFVSLFFVSLGLLFDVHFTIENFGFVIAMVGLVLIVNFVVMTLLIISLGLPPRIAMTVGIILSQIGEFSFLLLAVARRNGGIDEFLYQALLSTAFITMVMTPFMFLLIPVINKISEQFKLLGMHPTEWGRSEMTSFTLKDHVILCGFGPSGKDLSMTFVEEKISFILVEVNPVKVREARGMKIPVIYGDAANIEVIKRAGIEHARAVVVSFPDPMGMAQIIRIVQRLNPDVVIAVRTQYEFEMPKLYELGADIVVMEEWQASHELNRLILEHFSVSRERIERHLDRIHARKELAVETAIFQRTMPSSPGKKPSSKP